MNFIDIIVLAAMAWAAYSGWKRGMILQICTLLGIALGFWLAAQYGAAVGQALHITGRFATAGGFAVVLVTVIIIVAVVSRLLRNTFRFAGLGSLDVVLGVLFSCVKMLLILCALLWVFDVLNGDTHRFLSEQTLAGSKLYRPILDLARHITPVLDGVTDTVREVL